MKNLKQLQDEGLFDHIGISECSAATLEKAFAVRDPFLPLCETDWRLMLMCRLIGCARRAR